MDSNRRSHTRCTVCGTRDSNRSYHKIPSEPTMRRKWIEACNLPLSARDSRSAMYVCNLHFDKNDYSQNVDRRRRKIRRTAVPSLLLKQPAPSDFKITEKNSSHSHPTGSNSSSNTILTEQNSSSDTNLGQKNDSTRRYHNSCVICGRNDKQYSYHRFPKDNGHRSEWLRACKLKEEEYLPKMLVCGKHFRESDFSSLEKKNCSHRTLRKNVFPSIFLEDLKKNYGIFCAICGTKNKGYSHHRFPKDNEKRNQWLQACKLSEEEFLPRMTVCGKHFQDDDFIYSSRGENRLKGRAIPSLFLQSVEKINNLELDVNNVFIKSDSGDKVANVIQNTFNSVENVICDDSSSFIFCEATLSTSDRLDSNELTSDDSEDMEVSVNPNPSHPIGNKLSNVCTINLISPDSSEKPALCKSRDDLQLAANSVSDHSYSTDELENTDAKQHAIIPHELNTNLLTINDSVTKILLVNDPLESDSEMGSLTVLPTDAASLDIFPEVVIDENVSSTSTAGPKKKSRRNYKDDCSIFWRYAADVGVRHCQTPEEALRSVNFLKDIVFKQRKMIVSFKKALRRRDYRIQKMKSVVDELRKNRKKSRPSEIVEVVVVPV